jgi:hypothetical protein
MPSSSSTIVHRVLEQVLPVASCRLIEDGGQHAAHDLGVPARDARDPGGVRTSITAETTPVHSATSIAGPNRFTAWPLVPYRNNRPHTFSLLEKPD